MEVEDDEDLKLVKASAALLSDLERHLPRLLWKPSKRAHSKVKRRDIDTIVNLIEPFQGEPQLLDAKLNSLVPNIASAYLDFLQPSGDDRSRNCDALDLESAICTLLYTLCKVRGHKVIVGLLNNEPKHLEKILAALERTIEVSIPQVPWQVPYVLLLWLSHLLLTPFDLASISAKPAPVKGSEPLPPDLPPLAVRALRVGMEYLPVSTKAQEATAAMVVKLSVRPDVVRLGLADILVRRHLGFLQADSTDVGGVYALLGSLRLLSGVSGAAELRNLIPEIYHVCRKIFDDDDSADTHALSTNAVAKKLVVKTFRNIAITCLRSVALNGALGTFLQDSDVLESIVDYLMRSLSDKDTPVRYAAAKAISLIVLELEPEMGHEIIQAVLNSFKEDMPRSADMLDYTTADPLRWHGLTLALAHTLFKRSASPQQLPDILDALIAALQFQQRSTTGNLLGTNVRDAANFGIWSLARRYTTAELLSVEPNNLHRGNISGHTTSIIQVLATQLLLSACLDSEGNIRRGSSAALQEVVGRHPNEVFSGISLVQAVDYQSVSLRLRAMISVAEKAAALHSSYWEALRIALLGWRGLRSSSVEIREDAATSVAVLAKAVQPLDDLDSLRDILRLIKECSQQDVELLHGYTLAVAMILEHGKHSPGGCKYLQKNISEVVQILDALRPALKDFSARVLRSQYPVALTRLLGTLLLSLRSWRDDDPGLDLSIVSLGTIDSIVERLFTRHEHWLLPQIPQLARGLFWLKRTTKEPLGQIGVQSLSQAVTKDSSKSTPSGTARAIALGALAPLYDDLATPTYSQPKAMLAVAALASMMTSMTVDWRVTAAKALLSTIGELGKLQHCDKALLKTICDAVECGLNDYTIDERGDVGSLVRLQCLDCAAALVPLVRYDPQHLITLKANIHRLALEKLDRVRLRAASLSVLQQGFGTQLTVAHGMSGIDIAFITSRRYIENVLHPLLREGGAQTLDQVSTEALVEGLISCAGIANEQLLQASRAVLATALLSSSETSSRRNGIMLSTLDAVMRDQLAKNANLHSALELLAFVMDMQIQSSIPSDFKWRNLLSTVQKAHHKSSDIPKILAAVHCYIGLAQVPTIRDETIKKLISMLKTNPYFRVRAAVAEALFVATDDQELRQLDCSHKLPSGDSDRLLSKHVGNV